MRILLIFVDADHAADVERLLDEHGVPGYSRFPEVLGKGATGRKFGNRAFPGASELFFVALPDGSCAGLCDGLEQLRTARGPEEGLRAYVMEANQII
ncbi:MAG TPA: hypothetical protein VFH97_10640 [Gemmatimonadales bacterium]|nr:hypothetical protein [Gemmatimonadales bacterium]